MCVRAAYLRFRHDRAAVFAVRRKPVACYECGDLIRGQLLVSEFVAGPEHDLQRSIPLAQRRDGPIRLVGIASFGGDIDEEHRLPGEAGKINAAPGQRRLALVVVQLHRCRVVYEYAIFGLAAANIFPKNFQTTPCCVDLLEARARLLTA